MNSEDGFLLLVESERKIFIEAFEVVDAGFGVDLLGIGGNQRRTNFLSALNLLIIFFDEGAFELRHLNIYY